MCKKLLFLISFVLLVGLVSSASAAAKFDYRVCWWSDLGPGHDWNEPNNWYTMDRFWNDADNDDNIDTLERKYYVKVHPNQVPDINCVALIGKGNASVDYPEYLHFNPPPVDPTISSGTAVAGDVMCSGGYSLDPNKVGGGAQGCVDHGDPNHWDPCMHHELTITGGQLDVGTPQTWEGYDTQYGYYGYFYGAWGGNCLRIGTVGWYPPELGPGKGQGTMNLSGTGIVNVGGHMELGAWEQTIGTLNMTGGTINITQGLYCPAMPWGATGRVNLRGGTINARYIFMNDFTSGDSGSIDVAGGKFILSRGNEVEELTDYSNGIGLGGAGVVSLTAYGVGHGEIVTDDVNFPDACGRRAALSIDYDVSNEAKTTVQAFLTDPNQAWNPSPPDGAGNVTGTAANIARPVLSWSAGDGAVSHEVYFSSNQSLVDTRNVSVRKQTIYDPCSWTVDADLTSLATYYWAIDENPGPMLGQVWGFTMANLSKASLPSPGDGEVDVNPVVDLSWVSGIYAVTHDVYFGTNFDDVNDANTSVDPNNVFMGNQVPNTFDTSNYDANGLEFSTTYYWRVDECNSGGIPLWPGGVWSFTTSDHIDVDDFDSYADTAALKAVWSGKNDVVIEVATDPNIGGNSMMAAYRNYTTSGGKFVGVETEADTVDLEVGTDWTASGVEALVLNFYGDAGNGQEGQYYTSYHITNDQMYVALEDGSAKIGIVKLPDMNDIQEASWQEWNIDLQDPCLSDVDMNNVVKVYIGFGGQKTGQAKAGAGFKSGKYDTVWFDDIGLWPIRCIPEYTSVTDFTGDCVVNEQDFDVMAGHWLMTDYSSFGYTGTLMGFHGPGEPNYDNCWVTGKVDSNTALYFNLGGTPQGDEYVKTPPLNLNSNTVSITLWAKRHGLQRDDGGLFFCSYIDDGPGTTQSGFIMGLSGDNSLNYNWQNDIKSYGWNPILPVLPEDEWAFCALTVAPTSAKIYIMPTSTGTIFSDENTGVTHDPEAFGIPSRIGDHKGRRFVGTMDDFRIYDKTLNAGEVEFLAKLGASGTDPTDANLYAHYTFDDATGLVALDDAGDMVNWWPVPSQANFVDPEAEGERSVNFRDYVVLANDWLKEPTWPPRP